MKWLAITILIFLLCNKSYGQRHFTLADATHRDTLIYMNDSTGHYVPIPVDNLTLDRSKIDKISCGEQEAIRTNMLKNGIAVLIDFKSASQGDKHSQILAYRNKIGLWAFGNSAVKKIANENIETVNKISQKPNSVLHPNYVTKNIRGKIISRDVITLKSKLSDTIELSKLKNQRIFVYRYTKNKRLCFRRVLGPHKFGDVFKLSMDNLSVEYNRLDTVYVGEKLMLKKALVLIGAIGLNYPGKETDNSVRNALYFAQNNKIGIWHNFDKNHLEPDIINRKPPRTEDPDMKPLTWWDKTKLFVHNCLKMTARLRKSSWLTFASLLLNIVLSFLQIKNLARSGRR